MKTRSFYLLWSPQSIKTESRSPLSPTHSGKLEAVQTEHSTREIAGSKRIAEKEIESRDYPEEVVVRFL
jgi:hypothetical protein